MASSANALIDRLISGQRTRVGVSGPQGTAARPRLGSHRRRRGTGCVATSDPPVGVRRAATLARAGQVRWETAPFPFLLTRWRHDRLAAALTPAACISGNGVGLRAERGGRTRPGLWWRRRGGSAQTMPERGGTGGVDPGVIGVRPLSPKACASLAGVSYHTIL